MVGDQHVGEGGRGCQLLRSMDLQEYWGEHECLGFQDKQMYQGVHLGHLQKLISQMMHYETCYDWGWGTVGVSSSQFQKTRIG